MALSHEEFSFKSRDASLRRFKDEVFDLLVIGGGITGAASARDAATRGLKVALVDKGDFAVGTSSRSTKLIHGGLRYLENMEFALVFESLSERAFLLKSSPHMVRPIPFYFPVYKGLTRSKFIINIGMWLYDMLSLFRAPEFHKTYNKKQFSELFPSIQTDGLGGGFKYYDASMWDDVLTIETLRAAHRDGAAIANYTQAVSPIWTGDRITGYRVRDLMPGGVGEIELKAKRVLICVGPWTDLLGQQLDNKWRPWLNASTGVHLVFDAKRLPLKGAVVMSHPSDGRISFAIPRDDFGNGVTIVGTTDGPAPKLPEDLQVQKTDIDYLMALLGRYFPSLKLTPEDILSAYVGIRPLVGNISTNNDEIPGSTSLQKVSREHYIGNGPGGTVIVAGGKYTTHRKMAEEIVDHVVQAWKNDQGRNTNVSPMPVIHRPRTKVPVNPRATFEAMDHARSESERRGLKLPETLLQRYGAAALDIVDRGEASAGSKSDPEGFPLLQEQLRFAIRNEMCMNLDDFYFRRSALFSSRKDHGLPWAETLAKLFIEERGLPESELKSQISRVQKAVADLDAWRKSL